MKHTMLMWRKPSPGALQEKIAAAFQVLSFFADAGGAMKPRYLTAYRKSAVRELKWSLDAFSEKLLKNPVNDKNPALEELGYSISLFSSLNETKSLSFRITVGNQSPKLLDVIAISFPADFFQDNPQALDRLPDLFRKSVEAFSPFWACVTEKAFQKKYDGFFQNEHPYSVQWINYWSDSLFEPFGTEYAKKVLKRFHIDLEDGIFILWPEPVDLADAQMAALCASVNEALGLPGR